jgi:hypothetical protein
VEPAVANARDIQIDHNHSRAICAEIGERLRFALPQSQPFSPRLAILMERLQELDAQDAPSIVP